MDDRSECTRVFWIATLAACLNGVAVGNLAGWPQAAIPQLLSPGRDTGSPAFTEAEVSWIAGIFFLGMLAGGFTSLGVAGRFGKRRLFLLASVPLLLGWSAVAVAASFWEFILGRITLGLGGGMMCHQTEMYLSEISPRRLRGNMSVMFCACVHLGVLLSFGVGPILSISTATGIYLAVVLLLVAAYLLAAPETPFWLARVGRHEEALASLRKLRRRGLDVHAELEEIVEFVERSNGTGAGDGAWKSLRRLVLNDANRRAILLVVLLTTAQQFSGMAALHSYAQLIFERAATAVPGRYVSLLLGLIEFGCTVVSGFLVERVGRRPLVATSTVLCSGCMAILGLYFRGLVTDASGALPVACIVVFALASGLGLATMATVIAAECLSMEARNIGAAAQNTTVCFSVFLITKLWQVISTSYGQEYSFWTASAITAGHTVLLLILLPETRGRSLAEIQRLLGASSERTESFLPVLQSIKIVPMRAAGQLVTGKDTAVQ